MAETACHCGQLRLTVTAPPVHVHLCTCTRCQRASGSIGGWNGWFPKAAITVRGSTGLYLIEGPDHPEAFAAFCPNCGSGGYSTTPGYLDHCWVIPMGSFGDPQAPAPSMVHFWNNRPGWVEGMADLPKGLAD